MKRSKLKIGCVLIVSAGVATGCADKVIDATDDEGRDSRSQGRDERDDDYDVGIGTGGFQGTCCDGTGGLTGTGGAGFGGYVGTPAQGAGAGPGGFGGAYWDEYGGDED
jgi:hypothetical protein